LINDVIPNIRYTYRKRGITIGKHFSDRNLLFFISSVTQYITTRQTLIFPKIVILPDFYER